MPNYLAIVKSDGKIGAVFFELYSDALLFVNAAEDKTNCYYEMYIRDNGEYQILMCKGPEPEV